MSDVVATQRPGSFVAGRWDDRTGHPPNPTRGFYSWSELGGGAIAGVVGGNQGGKAYVDDRFYAKFRGAALVEFIWGGREHVRDVEVPGEWDASVEAVQQEHVEIFLDWHDEALWDRGHLVLADGRHAALERVPGGLLLPPRGPASGMDRVAALTRRTGIMTRF